MRSREEIKGSLVPCGGGTGGSGSSVGPTDRKDSVQEAILEVVLDIRDMLQPPLYESSLSPKTMKAFRNGELVVEVS